ncbi:MAG TPA: signal peptidase II [Gemmata sp.]|jgi:lipoprotein signal peptidase|nr:signal peptidase II [Gemmata sp.]
MHRTYRWLLITFAAIGLTADQTSKYGVFRWLYKDGQFAESYGNSYDVVPNWFKLISQFDPDMPLCECGFSGLQTWSAPVMPRVNHGALFGMGGSKKGTANGFFAGVSVAAAIAILVWGLRRNTARDPWLMATLGLILAGTVGNLYDRLVFNGVRDFLYFYRIDWPVFNVADCCLVVGAGLLLFQAVFITPRAEVKSEDHQEAAIPAAPKL